MKPWLETWELESVDREAEEQFERFARVVVHRGTDRFVGGYNMSIDDDESRARLAASAPQLVRALLAVEWDGGDQNAESVCPDCAAPKYPYMAVSAGYGELPRKHRSGCALDSALTAAGLPDQASRDAARSELAKR